VAVEDGDNRLMRRLAQVHYDLQDWVLRSRLTKASISTQKHSNLHTQELYSRSEFDLVGPMRSKPCRSPDTLNMGKNSCDAYGKRLTMRIMRI
jgi:hypothetical protein